MVLKAGRTWLKFLKSKVFNRLSALGTAAPVKESKDAGLKDSAE